ncbi:MAG: hypothetical protein ACLP6E_10480 [Acidimicrobiales bacterium]
MADVVVLGGGPAELRVLEVALSSPPYSSPGPNRAELEEILA